jgi:hypothetical protein
MPDGGWRTKRDNGRLVLQFVGLEEPGEGVEELAEEASVELGMLLEVPATYQEQVEVHRRQEGVEPA